MGIKNNKFEKKNIKFRMLYKNNYRKRKKINKKKYINM
jgi:hypothetical protein